MIYAYIRQLHAPAANDVVDRQIQRVDRWAKDNNIQEIEIIKEDCDSHLNLMGRPKASKLIPKLTENDTLVVTSLLVLFRTAEEGIGFFSIPKVFRMIILDFPVPIPLGTNAGKFMTGMIRLGLSYGIISRSQTKRAEAGRYRKGEVETRTQIGETTVSYRPGPAGRRVYPDWAFRCMACFVLHLSRKGMNAQKISDKMNGLGIQNTWRFGERPGRGAYPKWRSGTIELLLSRLVPGLIKTWIDDGEKNVPPVRVRDMLEAVVTPLTYEPPPKPKAYKDGESPIEQHNKKRRMVRGTSEDH